MKRIPLIRPKQNSFIVICVIALLIVSFAQYIYNRTTRTKTSHSLNSSPPNKNRIEKTLFYRRQSCSCTRPLLKQNSNLLILDETLTSLCSQYATLRSFNQRIISISMYGPIENSLFALNTSMDFLRELIADMKKFYPNWILRIYHDTSIKDDIICPIECAHHNVDFCNASSLGNLGSLSSYIPPKIWRFLPLGDKLVDIMGSRDLDSPISQRELDAVNDWISSGKTWHAMRDNPEHGVPMLGGMWGSRPALNRSITNYILHRILDRSIVIHYGGRGDQNFLQDYVWPHVEDDVIAHDSFLCTTFKDKGTRPWPTRRPHPSNDTNCFVGCVRPCCIPPDYPFGECPTVCRPKDHADWTMC